MGLTPWYAGEYRHLFLHFIGFQGVGIPFMYTQGFTDLAMAGTLTRTGSGMRRSGTCVLSFRESVHVQGHRLSTGFGFVSQPNV